MTHPNTRSLDRFRLAMRFSLWVWALYWPGGGLLLLLGGLDPVSVLVTFGSLACFIALIASGALRADASRNMKEFLLERPMYLVLVLVALVFLAPLFQPAENLGLRLFATLYLGGILLAAWRLLEHVKARAGPDDEEGLARMCRRLAGPAYRMKADQPLLVFLLAGAAASLVLLDAWLPAFGMDPAGGSHALVAAANWVNLLYPPLLMLATKPFRAPLQWPSRRGRLEKGRQAPAPGAGLRA